MSPMVSGRTKHRSPLTRRAFTLVEMLTVVALMGIILLIAFPMIAAIDKAGRIAAGINTVNTGVAAARAYSSRNVVDRTDVDASMRYSGVALLFTPNGDLRLVENNQLMKNSSDAYLEISGKNGYSDIPGRDYINIPSGTGILGISKPGTTTAFPELLAPPFAVRFDRNGALIAGITAGSSRTVFYDSNYDNVVTVSKVRPAGYDPDAWDPDSTTYNTNYSQTGYSGVSPVDSRHLLPFEEIETVIGVLVYNKRAFWDSGGSLPSTVPQGTNPSTNAPWTSVEQWMLANGKVMFFSRYTGTVIREGKIQ